MKVLLKDKIMHCYLFWLLQVFDNTPATKDGTLASGDEIVGVNGKSVKGRTKVEVARMIQAIKVMQIILRGISNSLFI